MLESRGLERRQVARPRSREYLAYGAVQTELDTVPHRELPHVEIAFRNDHQQVCGVKNHFLVHLFKGDLRSRLQQNALLFGGSGIDFGEAQFVENRNLRVVGFRMSCERKVKARVGRSSDEDRITAFWREIASHISRRPAIDAYSSAF